MPTLFLRLSAVALAGLLTAMTGCSSSDTSAADAEGDGTAEDDAELRAGSLAGTYRIETSPDPDGLIFTWMETLSIKTDGTFYGDEQSIVFDQDGMNSQVGHLEIRGKYTLKKSTDGKSTWIALSYPLPDGSKGQSKYFYKTAPGGMMMSIDVRGPERDADFLFMKLDRMNAHCERPSDCGLQNVPQPKCPGEWKCAKVRPDDVASYTIDVCRYSSTRCGS